MDQVGGEEEGRAGPTIPAKAPPPTPWLPLISHPGHSRTMHRSDRYSGRAGCATVSCERWNGLVVIRTGLGIIQI